MESIMLLKIALVLQLVIAIGLINVWAVRVNRATKYRGGRAKNMVEEFSEYGLPSWAVYVVGGIKLVIAALMIVGVWYPGVVLPAAAALVVLMLGAVAMHVKVRDPFIKMVPALAMLALSAAVAGIMIRVF